GGNPYLVMQLLEGEPLDDLLRRVKTLPAPTAMRIGRQAALGLAAAHQRGMIHRDVKPSNPWLETGEPIREGPPERFRVKVLDFGLARVLEQSEGMTNPGSILGTPGYMAPEQARGEAVGPPCDLFSLGCVLYRLTTGKPPFPGDNIPAQLLAV